MPGHALQWWCVVPVTTYVLMRVPSVIHARMRPLLVCTHPCVAPEFTHDLPRCHIPQHHRLVPPAGTETAVVKGARGQRREGQRRSPMPQCPDPSRAPSSPGRVQHLVAVAAVRPQQRPSQRVPELQGLVAAASQAVIAIRWRRPGGGLQGRPPQEREDPI